MNHVETWVIAYADDIEPKVNSYCAKRHLNPISISITHCPPLGFVVGLVVESEGD